jgi:hypothetical protein
MSQPYSWQSLYEAAVLETDSEKLSQKVDAAHAAIHARMEELNHNGGLSHPESVAIHDALTGLRVLRRERLQSSKLGA